MGKKRRSRKSRNRSGSRERKQHAVVTPPTEEDLMRAFAEYSREMSRRGERYREFVESIKALPPLEKAEAWLAYFADHQEEWGDQESLVYLRSREHDCSRQIQNLIGTWKRAEVEVVRRSAVGTPVYDWGTSKTTQERIGRISPLDVSDIRKLSHLQLRDFWSGADHQEFSIDATMLRTVEWCEIGGFSRWWERLAETFYTNILRGGVEPVPAVYLLFNLCRSDYARRLMAQGLETVLHALEVGDHDSDAPWRVFASFRPTGLTAHLGYASTLVFAGTMLRPQTTRNNPLIARAAEALLRHQRPDGAWSIWEGDASASISSTAMAMHALALVRPLGWERSVELGKTWLCQAERDDGCWLDEYDPDPTYLTVLVLDAIELAQGGSRVTFSVPGGGTVSRKTTLSRPSETRPRFLVALSFPGEVRQDVATVARLLADQVGRDKVFYDAYYKAELARLDLDVHLQGIYRDQSLLVVVFLSSDYASKRWCGLEWRAIRDIIGTKSDQVMPIRLDDTEIPGLFSIDGYLDFEKHTPEEVADLILRRMRSLQGQTHPEP